MAIEFAFSPEDEAFRETVINALERYLPIDIRQQVADERIDLSRHDQARWQAILHSLGWGGLGLPSDQGGTGWSPEQYFIFLRELGRIDAPRPPLYGLKMVAPTLLRFGTRQQIEAHLAPIVEGRSFWCLGFSEPNAGSDLAALKCAARRVDGGYEITGSKTWISDAHHADFMCGFFRTDSTGKKQEGITALLIDMTHPGVTVRPLPNYEGTHECNEVFFDNVFVPDGSLIGQPGQGWEVVKYLLTVERFDLAEVPRSIATLGRVRAALAVMADDPMQSEQVAALLPRFARVEIDLRALAATECRYVLGMPADKLCGAEASLLKWIGTEIQQDILELLMDCHGIASQAGLPSDAEPTQAKVAGGYAGRAFHRYRVTTIYGGSTEIQKELIARTALGLRG